jgi:hypothetical protein
VMAAATKPVHGLPGMDARALRLAVRAYFRNDRELCAAVIAHLTEDGVNNSEAARRAGMSRFGMLKHVRAFRVHMAEAMRAEGLAG